MKQTPFQNGFRHMRRGFIGLVGFTILGIGIALTVLPGPAVLVIPIGLGVLATEFVWAQRTLNRLKDGTERFKSKWSSDKRQTEPPTAGS